MNTVTVESINQAAQNLKDVVKHTPLQRSDRLSEIFGATVYLKREDLQDVRSYKIRGAYNLMSSLPSIEKKHGVVCASAGNHAQGVAFSAKKLKIKSTIFMPVVTPLQKIGKVKKFGGNWIDIKLVGQTYDESYEAAYVFSQKHHATLVHPFNDEKIIAGQGTVGKEIFESQKDIDYLFVPIGGGGLISGIATYIKTKSPQTKIIGVEPLGAPSMKASLDKGKLITLKTIDTFVDGAAVKKVGDKTFKIVSKLVNNVITVPEGQICTTMIELYQNEGIVAEPAGALSIAALEIFKKELKDKRVVCILSGGNNDILRYPEIMERSLVYLGLKHYFLIEFAQKPGQLRQFVDKALGATDDIVRFEYIKKTSKERGPALVGIEVAKKEDYEQLVNRMKKIGLRFREITSSDLLYSYLV